MPRKKSKAQESSVKSKKTKKSTSSKTKKSKEAEASLITDLSGIKSVLDPSEHKAKSAILFLCLIVVVMSAFAYGYCFREMDKVDRVMQLPQRVALYK